MKKWISVLCILGLLAVPVFASGGEEGVMSTSFLLAFVILVIPAKLLGALLRRIGLPDVVGYILWGIILSGLGIHIHYFETIGDDPWIMGSALLGSIVLMFSTGLESSVPQMKKVGRVSMYVAGLGMFGPLILVPATAILLNALGIFECDTNAAIFIGASLTATSVGVPAEVFSSLNILKHELCQTVIGAGVVDDVGGVTVLSILRGALGGAGVQLVTIAGIILKAIMFLSLGIGLGHILARPIAGFISTIERRHAMKFVLSFGFMIVYAVLAELVGLAAIIGGYTAGLLLEPAHHFESFSKPHVQRRLYGIISKEGGNGEIEEVVKEMEHGEVLYAFKSFKELFVALFFVTVGLEVHFPSLTQIDLYPAAIVITLTALFGKLIAGWPVKGGIWHQLFVGTCMCIRGEVGFVFAQAGVALGVLNDIQFSTLIIVILATTILPVPAIKYLVAKAGIQPTSSEAQAHSH